MKADTLRPELKEKIYDWLVSFHRLDPRYQILTFFNLVATQGADNLLDTTEDEEWGGDYASDAPDNFVAPSGLRASTENMLCKVFNTTSILTVWRPCSNDAMRKMMEGVGVGKGLDIKGKSAQKGELSAFVPLCKFTQKSASVLYKKLENRIRCGCIFPPKKRANRSLIL
jgi:hypothetical protein